MIEKSLDRLKRDYNELQNFLKRLERDGELNRIPLVQSKMKFLVSAIVRLES